MIYDNRIKEENQEIETEYKKHKKEMVKTFIVLFLTVLVIITIMIIKGCNL